MRMIGLDLLIYVFGFVGWSYALHARGQRNDAYTDLTQLVHDYDVEYDELRRTHGHKGIERYFGNDVDNIFGGDTDE